MLRMVVSRWDMEVLPMVGAAREVRRPVLTRTHGTGRDTGGRRRPGLRWLAWSRCLPACAPPTRWRSARRWTRCPRRADRAELSCSSSTSWPCSPSARPARSVEVRVPPYAAAQVIPGVRHTRGTPPAVVELDADTWIALATGALTWPEARGRRAGRAPPASAPTWRRTCRSADRAAGAPRVAGMDIEELRTRVQAELPRLRSDLEDLVRIESVSADPARAAEVQRSAEAVAALFRAEGFEDTEIVSAREDGRAPAVIARKPAPRGSADGAALRPPRRAARERPRRVDLAALRADRARRPALRAAARPTTRPAIVAHLAAVRALGADLGVGVTVFVEGEEEVGSDTLPDLLREHAEALRADVIVIADSSNWDIGVPALTTSLRGLVRVDVTVRTLTHAVHSGMWGGLVPDALMALTRLLASLHDDRGDVAIEGLHSGPAADVDYPPTGSGPSPAPTRGSS